MACNINHLFKKPLIFIVMTIPLFSSTSLVAEIGTVELGNFLSVKDQISNAVGYKISSVVATQDNQFGDPNQGMVFEDCEVTWTKEGAFAMKKISHYEKAPVFGQFNTRNYRRSDYDEKSNLIVWRTLEEYIVSTPERNDELKKSRVFFVDPNDKIVQTGDNTILYRWPIDKPYSVYQLKYYQFPMGRAFSRHVGTITSAKTLSSGLLKVASKCSITQGIPGDWELTIDPNSDWLVREACFTMEGQNKPTEVFTSSGIIEKDGIKLAKYGTFRRASGSERAVEVTDISKMDGPNKLYEAVLSRLNSPLPPGTSIVDLRGEKPVRTTVK